MTSLPRFLAGLTGVGLVLGACSGAAEEEAIPELAAPGEVAVGSPGPAIGYGDDIGTVAADRDNETGDRDAPGQAQPGEGEMPPAHVQSYEEALAQDIGLIAEANGWTFEEGLANHRTSEIVGDIAGQIAIERPEIFVGSALSDDPLGAPTLYIKGPADQYVLGLVSAAEIEIIVADDQRFSFDELDEGNSEITAALRRIGFRSMAVGFTFEGPKFHATVTREPGLPENPDDEIVAAVSEPWRSHLVLTLTDGPVTLIEQDGGEW